MPAIASNANTVWRYCVLSLLILCLSACTTKVAYNMMDWAMEWKVQRIVKLQHEQKLMTQRAIKDFHYWHRTTQLPLYADYLKQLKHRLDTGPINAQDIHAETDKIQTLIDSSVQKILPDIVEVLATINEKQVKELLDKATEERKEYKEDYVDLTPAKRAQKYAKEYTKHAQRWIGPLSKKQKEQVKQWSLSLTPFEELNLEQQKIWEETFEKILAQRHNKALLLKEMQNLMLYRTDSWQPELKERMDHNQTISYQLIADHLNGLSNEQKKHLNKKLDDYIRILTELANETKNPPPSLKAP